MKKFIPVLVRKVGLIKFADKIRFYILFAKTYKNRKAFKRDNPGVVLPPPFFLYETFNLNYNSFYYDSINSAKWLISYFEKYKTLENLNILDWGCGPGRVIRHFPNLVGQNCRFYGTDYNKKYVKWCKRNIPDVQFSLNKLEPSLHFENNLFDIIYGISVFTHLSKEMHFSWFNELIRILKPGGILLVTLHGKAFKNKLTEAEKLVFEKGELVVKSNTKEGHRTFAAFQPDDFVKTLVGNHKIMEHSEGDTKNGKPRQDIWVIKKEA